MERVCKRCLLRELKGEEYFHSVYAYIDSLPAHTRAPEAQYRERLAHCQSCDHLINGMCDHCGCFVEVRAAKAQSRCPDTNPKW